MGSNWPLKSLKELGVSLIDCVHKTPTAVDDGIPYIGIPQMKGGTIDFSANPRLISEDDYQLWTVKAKPTYGDIVLSRRCNPGETAYVPQGCKFALGQNLVLLRPDPEKIHPGYLRWVVNSPIWWEEVSKYKNPGAIFDSLKCVDIPNFEVPEPTYLAQVLIDKYLLDISDKIELNQQINQTLEQMAQTLFKSWFVDFDPVVDNALDAGFFEQDLEFSEELLHRAEARRTVRESVDFKALPDAILQLFPASFEECAEPSLGLGGWVPEGWEPSNIGVEFDVTMGQSPPGSTYNEIGNGLPFFQGKTDFGFRFPSNRVYCTEPKRMAKKHDTLISVRAPVGDINLAAEDCAIGRGLAAARHKSGSMSFSYYVMNSLSKCFEVFDGEGTVFGSINQKDFKALPLIKYPGEIITKFDEICGNWDKRINHIALEVWALTDLRDTLLPRLISGELRLSELEVKVAEVDLD